jgi:SWI/SNF-related matrix-associated actin-dependent regulator of chromatin subfamily A member 5
VVLRYEGVLKEKGPLTRIQWNYLMIDEAHRIKNEKSSLSMAVRTK